MTANSLRQLTQVEEPPLGSNTITQYRYEVFGPLKQVSQREEIAVTVTELRTTDKILPDA